MAGSTQQSTSVQLESALPRVCHQNLLKVYQDVQRNATNITTPLSTHGCLFEAIGLAAFHGLKSAGASFNTHLARCLEHDLEFVCSKGDRDVWMRKAVKESDGSECY